MRSHPSNPNQLYFFINTDPNKTNQPNTMIANLFETMRMWGVEAPEALSEKEIRALLVEWTETDPKKVKGLEELFTVTNICLSLSSLISGDDMEDRISNIRKFLAFLKAVCPFVETIPTVSNRAQEVALESMFLRTVGTTVPHARTHIPRMDEESISKAMEILSALATLCPQCTPDDVRTALKDAGLPVPLIADKINVMTNASYVRVGDTNVGVVVPDMLSQPVSMQMVSDVAFEDTVIGLRHGGKALMTFLRRDAEAAGRFTEKTTTSLVVTGWIDATRTEAFQAGTMYTGDMLPGREPSGVHDVFFKFFSNDDKGNAALLAAVDSLLGAKPVCPALRW